MFRRLAFSIALAVISCLPTPVSAEVPPVIEPKVAGWPPSWIAIQEFTSDGDLRSRALPEDVRARISRDLDRIRTLRRTISDQGEPAAKSSRCIVWSKLSGLKEPLQGLSIEDLLNLSFQTYVGRITDYQQGLVDGFPGSVLEIEVTRSLKKATAKKTPQRLLVHFEHAELPIEDELICARSDRYPDLPAVGARVIVVQWKASDLPLLHAGNTELVFERADQTVSLPPGLSSINKDAVSGFDTIVSLSDTHNDVFFVSGE